MHLLYRASVAQTTKAGVLLVEGWVMPSPYLIVAALLLLSPMFLTIVAAIDVYVTSHKVLGGTANV